MRTDTFQIGSRRRSSGAALRPVFLLVLLLAIPAYAASRLASVIDWRVLLSAPLLLSIIAFFAYRSDKRRAEAGAWRIPEFTFHVMELFGGWPGAFLAQRLFRHKTSKASFQIIFWMIVLAHQFAAVDSLMDWRLSKEALRFVKSQAA